MVQENWLMFKSELLSAIDQYIPPRSKMKQRKRLYDKAKVSQLPGDWAAYRTIKNEITSEIKKSHANYQNRLFDNEGQVSKIFGNMSRTYVKTVLELVHWNWMIKS